jgi:RecB family exonuclease
MFPQRLHEDPLLLDELREQIDEGLVTRADRRDLERLLLRLAVGAATGRVYISFPRLELAESRPRVPSFYVLDLVRAATGSIPNHEVVQSEAAGRAQANLAWPAPQDPKQAIDDLEHDLAVLRGLLDHANPDEVRGRAHYMLKLNECLRRAVTDRWARGEPKWSKHDGLIRTTSTSRPVLSKHRLSERPYSVSALQRFASCPYQFLLSAIYRLRPIEEPEAVQHLDPLTRGSLFHRAQAEFLSTLDALGLLPPAATEPGRLFEILEAAVERVAREYHDLLAPAIERVWNDEIGAVRRDLRMWAQILADTPDWEPQLFEYSFGLPPDPAHDRRSTPAPVIIAGRFLLRGSVDLVERKRGGQVLRVTDHKTGRNRATPTLVIGGGSTLQPVLYSLAVESATGDPVAAGRLFFCTSVGGFTSHEIPINEDTKRAAIEALEIVDRSIELGFLAQAPAAGACALCDFRSVCGPGEEVRIRRKPPGLLEDLMELRRKP